MLNDLVSLLTIDPTQLVAADQAGPPADSVDTYVPDGQDPTSGDLSHMFLLEYRDSVGQFSRRTIRATRTVSYEGMRYLDAWCFLRNDWRRFREDRIKSLTNARNGEIVSNIDDYLDLLYAGEVSSPTRDDIVRSVDSLAAEAEQVMRPALIVLLAIGNADGSLVECERQAILDFVETQLRESAVDAPKSIAERVFRRICAYVPTREVAEASIDAISKDAGLRSQLADAIEAVVRADGRIDRAEMVVLRDVARWFGGTVAPPSAPPVASS
jgi:uncharacterized tellurite resistance protein B-like protein